MKKIIIITTMGFSVPSLSQNLPLETRSPESTYQPQNLLTKRASIPRINDLDQPLGFTSYQVNVDANGLNTLNDAANEPSLAVNPLNPAQIAVGWRQFDNVISDFRQAGKSNSTDGGQTWNYQPPFEPGVFRSDPVLEANADGEFYYQSLRVDFEQNGEYLSVDQWKSYDGGATWVEKTFAYGGDKSWFAIDKTDGPGRGNIYASWNGVGFFTYTFNRSLDAGNSYELPISIPSRPIMGTVDVSADSELYVVGTNESNFSRIFLVKSFNPLESPIAFPQETKIDMGGTFNFGSFINPVGLSGQVNVNVDKSNRPSRGNVYILSSINPDGPDSLDAVFTRSTDGGESFSEPEPLNTDSGENWQWFATQSVAPNGRIDIIWYDTRSEDGGQGDGQTSRLFYTYSYDGGLSFAKEEAITPAFPNRVGYPVQQKMGDYIDMESDNLGAHIAYSATYNDEQDVYYLNARPSAIEENPDFPTLLVNNAWAVEGVPRQGILSTNLINNSNPENPLRAFEAIFTATPEGDPMWLVATGETPLSGDSMTLPLLMPTGDLTDEGQPLMGIGLVTKSRLRDENNELVDNKILYTFDTTDAVKQQLADLIGDQYNEEFYNSSPFYNLNKSHAFRSLLPRGQSRQDLCNIHGQVLSSEGEKNEGRFQFTYLRDGVLNLFSGDFTYKKTFDDEGQASLVLDENNKAIPTWEVVQSNESGIQSNQSAENRVSTPNGGLGFFESGIDPGLTTIGMENIRLEGSTLITEKPHGSIENMKVLAKNAYCGENIIQ